MNEFDIIAGIFAPLATAPGAFALKDDAAAIPPRSGFDLIVTTDQIADGTDFFAHDPAEQIARKALRVNLSDLAAKGAVPAYYFLDAALPESVSERWLRDFAAGLKRDQDRFGISLLGGDTSRADNLSLCVTAMGYVPEGRMLRRAGARAGDALYVTGSIGDSAGGLALLKGEGRELERAHRDRLVGRYHVPEPPIALGPKLVGIARASIDVSDGLVADLGHLADTSAVRLVVDAGAIPRSPALRALWGEGAEAIVRAATAGDDYQIAFTADPAMEEALLKAAAESQTRIARIGRVEDGKGVAVLWQGKELPVSRPGYRHF